jgi:hypothetical protein
MPNRAFGLGRRVPPDFVHVDKYPYSAVAGPVPGRVEASLPLPRYRGLYDQGRRQACVGFASTWMTSLLNRRRYDPLWLWNQAKVRDTIPETEFGDRNQTTLRAALDVLRLEGHRRVWGRHVAPPQLGEGIAENRWATSVDQIRTSIESGVPVVLGVNWYASFNRPERVGNCSWIGRGSLGRLLGGHAVCVYRASDRLEAVGLVNSWGDRYPLTMLPYATLDRLLREDGEATLVTDRR